MSLLYECIHGIVQGGILESVEGTADGDELARLCVGKLRSMLVIEGDPNLKYVALLAFQKIVTSHSHLVSLHQDVILQCIDDPDISIRMRALDLAVGMVNADNLQLIVDRLVSQLLHAPFASASDEANNDRAFHNGIEPRADSDDEDPGESLRRGEDKSDQPVALPEDYRINAIRSILTICSRDTYSNVSDFEWYIEVLVKLVKACPSVSQSSFSRGSDHASDISLAIGEELQNVAVRVKSLRPEATLAAQSLLLVDTRPIYFPPTGNGGLGVLGPCAWIAGEYAEYLNNSDGVLSSLIHESSVDLPANTLAVFVHAALKVFATVCSLSESAWDPQNRTNLSLLMARFIHFLESLASHPALEVQERAVEYLELSRLASEATSSGADDSSGPPLLLTQAIPNLFVGMDLNPVAPGALLKVPMPEGLDLDAPINPDLHKLLQDADYDMAGPSDDGDFEAFYSHRIEPTSTAPRAAAEQLDSAAAYEAESYQQTSASSQLDAVDQSLRRKERRDRNKDDPFYIGGDNESTASTSLRNIIKSSNGEDLDIDSIPIMDLSLEVGTPRSGARTPVNYDPEQLKQQQKRKAQRKRIEIVGDETIDSSEPSLSSSFGSSARPIPARSKKSLLAVDSGGLGSLTLDDSGVGGKLSKLDIEQQEEEERALREVERLRLEMQRASERIQAKEEAVVVRKKKKKKVVSAAGDETAEVAEADADGNTVVKKKKKKKKEDSNGETVGAEPEENGDAAVATKRKKKARRVAAIDEPEVAAS
jgi:AP-3 complex subunit delta-1